MNKVELPIILIFYYTILLLIYLIFSYLFKQLYLYYVNKPKTIGILLDIFLFIIILLLFLIIISGIAYFDLILLFITSDTNHRDLFRAEDLIVFKDAGLTTNNIFL
jgi:hypothetical protein